ncbi:MAG: pyruvate ferredoxin oxidoreductase [Syntrophobacteraceae bacterium CG2_30_61_12]|nr:MAG: pyruvate ferredoxin oxidoreductase [Syntrophobacteraceae bacterium CG2_30_61_12]PIU31733.1 MAG: pyruvate ferredoxin oxidoreductase [Syntrophobacteraceae bacterium CG07_land_8_20_14_0_80_61_8]
MTTIQAHRTEITFTGFGGQGIVLLGKIVGEGAALGDHRQSTLTQSYGPEARGGACSAQVIIADQVIHYPYVRRPDILVCMSQGGFDRFAPDLKPDSLLLIDQGLVKLPRAFDHPVFAVPATQIAEELGRKMMANIVMLGFFTAVTGAVSEPAVRSTVEHSVPKGTEPMNLNAFTKGFDHGKALLKGREKKAAGRKGAL